MRFRVTKDFTFSTRDDDDLSSTCQHTWQTAQLSATPQNTSRSDDVTIFHFVKNKKYICICICIYVNIKLPPSLSLTPWEAGWSGGKMPPILNSGTGRRWMIISTLRPLYPRRYPWIWSWVALDERSLITFLNPTLNGTACPPCWYCCWHDIQRQAVHTKFLNIGQLVSAELTGQTDEHTHVPYTNWILGYFTTLFQLNKLRT